MSRVQEVRYCARCDSPFNRHNGNTNARYCSRLCACRDRNDRTHQVKAGSEGGKHNIAKRGTGSKAYVKYHGQHLHRAVMEEWLNLKLKANEIVHHIDGDKRNNNIDNLIVITRAEHMRIHLHGKT